MFVFAGSWPALNEHVAKGRPLIVALDGGVSPPQLHFVVVCGIDPNEDLVLVNDPAEKKLLSLRRNDFERRWQRSQNWTLLALPGSG